MAENNLKGHPIIGKIGNPDGKQDKPEGGYQGVGGSK